jgi:hypothetical protein
MHTYYCQYDIDVLPDSILRIQTPVFVAVN